MSSLKRLKGYFLLTESMSVTSFLLPWAVVLCLFGGLLTTLGGSTSSHNLAQAHPQHAEQKLGGNKAVYVLISSRVVGMSDSVDQRGIYEESILLFN
jgi:hypothetical protein